MFRRLFSSLRIRLIFLVHVALFPALLFIIYSASEQRQLSIHEAEDNVWRLARVAASEQERLIEGTHQLLKVLAELPVVRKEQGKACSELFSTLLKQNHSYANLGVIQLNGDVFCSALPFKGKINLADRIYFRKAIETRTFSIGEYQIGRITKSPTINFGYPVFNNKGGIQSVVYAAIDLSWLNHLKIDVELPQRGILFVIDKTGTILTRYPYSKELVGKTILDNPVIQEILRRGTGNSVIKGSDNIARLFSFAPIATGKMKDLYVSIGIPTDIVFAKARRSITHNLILFLIVIIFTLLLAWLIGDFLVVRQAGVLVETTQKISRGDLTARTGFPHKKGELGTIAQALDEMAKKLEIRQIEARRLENFKVEILQVISHELRTPLAIVKTVGEIFNEGSLGPLNEQQKKFFHILNDATKRLLILLDKVLLSTKILTGKIEYSFRPINTGNFLNEIGSNLKSSATAKQVTLEVMTCPQPISFMGDIKLLAEALNQIIENAIQTASPHGHVWLSCNRLPDYIEIKVSDTGTGIPAEDLPTIFDRFRWVGGINDRKTGGLGLGLFIAKAIVEAHKGTISMESFLGKGTSVFLRFPVL